VTMRRGSALACVALDFADRHRCCHGGYRGCSMDLIKYRAAFCRVWRVKWGGRRGVSVGALCCLKLNRESLDGHTSAAALPLLLAIASTLVTTPQVNRASPHLRFARNIYASRLSTPVLLSYALPRYPDYPDYQSSNFLRDLTLPVAPSLTIRSHHASHNGAHCAFKGSFSGCAEHSRAYSTLRRFTIDASLTAIQVLRSALSSKCSPGGRSFGMPVSARPTPTPTQHTRRDDLSLHIGALRPSRSDTASMLDVVSAPRHPRYCSWDCP
jgi:hypothetical protein